MTKTITSNILAELNHPPVESLQDKTIVLAGSGRSGTTWLGNIISANPNVGILFEPFDNRRVPDVLPLKLITYAREDGN
ncbi:MAG: hypothetical protein AAGD96_36710, partial [Chloroflexota bacterium]